MAVSVTNEAFLFLYALLGGASAGVLFDLFRTLRRLLRCGVVWVGVQDLLFWLLSAFIAFLFLFHFNNGQPRWYIFLGILLGALFYHLLLKDYVVRLFTYLARFLGKILCFCLRLLLLPVRLLYRIFRLPFLWAGRIFLRLFRFSGRKIHIICADFSGGIKKLKKRLKMY